MTMYDLMQALNPPGGERTPEECVRIEDRYIEIQHYEGYTEGEKESIFYAWVKRNIYKKKDEEIAKELKSTGQQVLF